MRVAIYARYSSNLQDGRSIADQIALARERAASEGWTVAGIYEDAAISGAAIVNRPGLQRLLADASKNLFDAVLTEDLDRLSRDQEDTAGLHKRLTYAGLKIVTLADGEIGKMHVGIKGLLSSIYLDNLAQKTKRGQIGRVAAGRIPGGRSYGYDVVESLTDRGRRTINEAKAEIVRRIFREYVSGRSPRAIARDLNAEGIPSPSGGLWNASTLNGSRKRANGILSNGLYAGEIVYNRQRFIKDPETGRRQARLNPPSEWRRQAVPELAIVDPETWQAAQAMRRDVGNNLTGARRPKRLLSGLMQCGCCGGSYIVRAKALLGCSRHANTGTCDNNHYVAAEEVERRVVAAVRRHLLAPEAVAAAVDAYRKERASLARERVKQMAAADRNLADVKAKISHIVTAIENGVDATTLAARLRELEERKADLEAAREELPPPEVVTLHPQAAKLYRDQIEALHQALAESSAMQTEAAQIFRSFIVEIRITPKGRGEPVDIDIIGDLAGLMAPTADEAARSVSVVAGVGFEPTTFRL